MPASLELHVESYGSGPALVLAHGFAGSARNFRAQARALSATHEVWLYDARGHARSPAPEDAAAYDEASLVSDFASVVARAAGAPVVGGLSLGAYTALLWALAAEPKPRGLVLSAFPRGASNPAQKRWALEFADVLERDGAEAAGARFVWGETARFDAQGAALIRQGFLEHSPRALAAILRNVLATASDPDALAPELRALDVPALLVVGALDSESLEPTRRLAELLPQSELLVVPNAGHVVNLAAPREFNAALVQFLSRVEGPANGA